MKPIFLFIGLTLISLSCQLHAVEPANVQESENSISMLWNGRILWRYNHDVGEGKPYFHPLANADGRVFTDVRPKDHPWHRGLWHSWKFINGVNYWEENRRTGLSDGKTSITSFEHKISPDNTVELSLKLSYAPAADPRPLLSESRTITVSAPDATGAYNIVWRSDFTALDQDLVLDRTPPTKEKAYAGYAGYSLRMTEELKAGTFTNSDGLADAKAHAMPARWMSHTSRLSTTVVFMDHPGNFTFPSKWYVGLGTNYMSPAILYDEPYELKAHQRLSLTYKVHVSSRALGQEEIEELWQSWTQPQ
ncbi:PmoA family protein [Luteolibacter algae]|uniref:PmoA family protein n=1 Tax=Luteolibacter algae TaxID=454151 RepID=A0ABW5D966_9BACT